MIIGIDIDDTITNSYKDIIDRIGNYYHIDANELKRNGISYYDIKDDKKNFPDYDNFTKANFEDIMRNVKPKEDAVDIINKLHEEGFQIYIISARNTHEYKTPYIYTHEYLIRNNIYFDKIIVEAHDKGKACKDNYVDLMIDDSIRNCTDVSREGIPVLIFDNVFNKDSSFERVYTWKEVYKKVHELYNKKEINK